MKKIAALSLTLAVLLLAAGACKSTGGASPAVNDLISRLPKTTTGIIVIDFKRAMNTEFVDKALKESKDYAKYQEFIQKTGIDPQKDIEAVVIGAIGAIGGPDTSGVGLVNLKYDRTALLARMKDEVKSLKEDVYEGVTLISGIEEKEAGEKPVVEGQEGAAEDKKEGQEAEKPAEGGDQAEAALAEAQDIIKTEKEMYIAFLDDTTIGFGTQDTLKAAVDVLKKKAEGAKTNAALMDLLKQANQKAMVWGTFAFNPEDIKKMAESNPMLSSLGSLKAMAVSFDYVSKKLDIEFKALTSEPGKNKEIADMLIGFKSMGGMMAGGKPEIAELLEKIEISSGKDNIRFHALIPEDLLAKLGKMAEEEVKNKLGTETKTEDAPKPDIQM
jgi:hypothetical protein